MLTPEMLQYPEVQSISKNPEKLVVFLHGLGSDGNDLISLVPYIQNALPTCHFISPHGIEAYDMAPFGRQWFSLADRRGETVLNLAKKNAILVQELIAQKQKALSLTNTDTILIGFSQGSMMSIYLTLIANEPYAAAIAFSGRLIKPTSISNKKTAICIIHGQDDDIVDALEAETLAEYFDENNIIYDKLIIDNLAHSIDSKGLKFAIKFLQKYCSIKI